jgi:hypothetical protein
VRSMRVFRLETRDGTGPYNAPECDRMSSLDFEQVGSHGFDPLSRRPDPSVDDDLPWWEANELAEELGPLLFGFVDIPQLCHWWRADELTGVQALCHQPLFVATWEVKRTWQSEHQVVFLAKEAKCAERLPLPTFIARERGET